MEYGVQLRCNYCCKSYERNGPLHLRALDLQWDYLCHAWNRIVLNIAIGQIAVRNQRAMKTQQDDGKQWNEQYFICQFGENSWNGIWFGSLAAFRCLSRSHTHKQSNTRSHSLFYFYMSTSLTIIAPTAAAVNSSDELLLFSPVEIAHAQISHVSHICWPVNRKRFP